MKTQNKICHKDDIKFLSCVDSDLKHIQDFVEQNWSGLDIKMARDVISAVIYKQSCILRLWDSNYIELNTFTLLRIFYPGT